MILETVVGKVGQKVKSHRYGDVIFHHVARACAVLLLILIVSIGWELVHYAWPAIDKFGLGFISSSSWDPVAEKFGAASSLWGTVASSLLAMVFAVPISLGVAIFLTQMAPEVIRQPISLAVELLAAIPSIIYGIWGLFVLSPWLASNVQPWVTAHLGSWPLVGELFQGSPLGMGIFTAGLVLSIMIIPFMAAVLSDIFATVPKTLKEASYGLGATRWEVITQVVLPFTKVGIFGGFMLGLGRALGETMAVTFVIGNAHRLTPSLFDPANSISSTLANEFTEATSELYLSSLMYLGLVLFLLTFVVLVLARLLLWHLSLKEGARS